MGKDELERRVHFPLVRSLPGFFVTENRPERTHQPVHILLSHKLPIKPFSGNFATTVRYPKPSSCDLAMLCVTHSVIRNDILE